MDGRFSGVTAPRKDLLLSVRKGRNCIACSTQLREGDTVVVWKLDRLSRSLKDVLHTMERIANAGAAFRSITENIDTTTRPDG